MAKKMGVLLSGCGFLDGAEIRESVLTLLAIEKHGAQYQCLAPSEITYPSVNHLNQQEEQTQKDVLTEAARIARGKILTLDQAQDYDALIIPGGFGVAKNFCQFATQGAASSVHPHISSFIKHFHEQNKPIGALCIAPALIALLFGHKGVELTIGNDPQTAQEIEKTGARHIECPAHDAVVDQKLKIVSTPAYMYDDENLVAISQGIDRAVSEVLRLC